MAAVDTFQGLTGGPYVNGAAVSPHDTNELTYVTRAIYIGGAGNIVLVTVGGDTLTLIALPVGTVFPVRAKIIKNTSTTATNIVALW